MNRTEGIGRLLLKRLRTRLSIPLGLRHDEGTHLKRSDWWRQKVLVPVDCQLSVVFSCVIVQLSIVHVAFFLHPAWIQLNANSAFYRNAITPYSNRFKPTFPLNRWTPMDKKPIDSNRNVLG